VPRKIEDDFEFAEEVKNAQKLLESAELEVLETRSHAQLPSFL